VRHRGKIEAAIANARGTLALREVGTPLQEVVWRHKPKPRKPVKSIYDLPSTTPESEALSKELKRAGFRFVGPTTVYASMQACGVVNDHIARCFVRAEVQRELDTALRKVR
jgi:DNA-3-methyladenine glycosylase I